MSTGLQQVFLPARCGTFSRRNDRSRQLCHIRAHRHEGDAANRRQHLQAMGVLGLSASSFLGADLGAAAEPDDSAITHRVLIEIGTCPDGFNQQRGLGESSLCKDFEPLGSLVIGLYGNLAPVTVNNFVLCVERGAYNGTLIHKILPGEFVQAGKQGPPRLGGVAAPSDLEAINPEVTSSRAFKLRHFYPGTVSLPLSVNDDDARIRSKPGYKNTEFLITTGPGPVPDLDGSNIVFGRVVEGMSNMSRLTDQPVFFPQERLRLMNSIATAIGDDRAKKAKASWGRPISPVVIVSAKLLPSTR